MGANSLACVCRASSKLLTWFLLEGLLEHRVHTVDILRCFYIENYSIFDIFQFLSTFSSHKYKIDSFNWQDQPNARTFILCQIKASMTNLNLLFVYHIFDQFESRSLCRSMIQSISHSNALSDISEHSEHSLLYYESFLNNFLIEMIRVLKIQIFHYI